MAETSKVYRMDDGFLFELRGTGPFKARSASDRTDDWPSWYVCAAADCRRNVMRFPDNPGAVLTDRLTAEAMADWANAHV